MGGSSALFVSPLRQPPNLQGPNSDAESGGLKRFAEAARPYFGGWTNPAIALYFGQNTVE